jgi:DNA topoisomerase-2
MARRYCGSNNINLLHPDGQFGSRHSNHAGAARYISAGLEKLTRLIFREVRTLEGLGFRV